MFKKSSQDGLVYGINEKENGVKSITVYVVSEKCGIITREWVMGILEKDFPNYTFEKGNPNTLNYIATPKVVENTTEETRTTEETSPKKTAITFDDLKNLYAKNFGLELRKGENGKYYTVPLKLGKTA